MFLLPLMLLAFTATAQYKAELRHVGPTVEDGVEMHVTPRPDLVIVSLASHIKPSMVTTGSESVDIIDQWAEREALGYEGRHYVITRPMYSHIGTAYVDAPMLTIGAAGLDGQVYQQWTWLQGEEELPAWDAELRAMIQTLDDAISTLQGQLQEAESQRDAFQGQVTSLTAERDAAVAAVAPLQAQVATLTSQRNEAQASLEEARTLLTQLINRLPPGLRP